MYLHKRKLKMNITYPLVNITGTGLFYNKDNWEILVKGEKALSLS